MISLDSLSHAFTIPITIAAWLVCHSASAYADSPPPPETFTKPAELVLTLSDDLPVAENPHLSQHALKPPSDNRSIKNQDKKGSLGMDCGMDVNPYPDMGNSLTSRLAGTCDLKYSY